MKKSYKSSNFLDTLDKYSKRKRKDTLESMRKREEMELKKAEEEITKEVNEMINNKLISMKHKIVIEVSKKEIEEKKKFFKRRKQIMEDIMKKCEDKLKDFASSLEYENSLKKQAKEISDFLNTDDTAIFVKPDDLKFESLIKEAFGRNCTITASKDIEIGGIRGYSKEKGVIVDNTLDTKLKEQEDWAIEKFGVLLSSD